MAPTDLFVAGLNFTQAESFSAGLYRFAADRSLVLSGAEAWLPASASAFWNEWSSKILEWLSRPGKLSPSVLNVIPSAEAEFAEIGLIRYDTLYGDIDILAVITAWWVTFTIVTVILMGFTSGGIAAGMSIYARQPSYVYLEASNKLMPL